MSERRFLYSVERTYPYPVEQLWSAWLDADSLSQWYSPTDLSVEPGTSVSEPKVDGIWTIGVSVPAYGFVAYFFGKYTAMVEHQLIEHTMNYTQDLAEFKAAVASPLEHLVRIEFESGESGTKVKFSQFGDLPEEQIPATTAGMESYFDNLGLFLQKN